MNDLIEIAEVALEAILQASNEVLAVYRSGRPETEYKADDSPLTEADRRSHDVITRLLAATGIPVLSEEGRDIAFEERHGWTRYWLVDPLDGTKEFIKRNGEFTVNIALIEQQVPVFGLVQAPDLGRLYGGMLGEGGFRSDVLPSRWNELATTENSIRVRPAVPGKALSVVASRSHRTPETDEMIEEMARGHDGFEVVSAGSSLKLCLVAEGAAHRYPRLGPTMEWDTAAGHAVVLAAGGTVNRIDDCEPLVYNKQDLLNPYFLVSSG